MCSAKPLPQDKSVLRPDGHDKAEPHHQPCEENREIHMQVSDPIAFGLCYLGAQD